MVSQSNNDMAKGTVLGAELLAFHFPRYDELPSIQLYLDQVLVILNETLTPFFEYGENKIITGAMVNNYVKLKVIQPPTKKRYSKSHLCHLFIICILKKIFSITEISEMIKMQTRQQTIESSYNHFCEALEWALNLKFAEKTVAEPLLKKNEDVDIERSIALAVANKLFVQKIMQTESSVAGREE